MKIMIVNSSSTICRQIMGDLRMLNHGQLVEAKDGPTCIAQLAQGRTELVMIDFRLPGMSGVELIRQIRKSDTTRRTPVILTVPYADRDQAALQLSGLKSALLIRPFKNPELRRALEQALAQAPAT